MKIADMKVTELINAVGSDAPAPGGGAVAGLAGGIGVALTMMVNGLTLSKKGFEDDRERILDEPRQRGVRRAHRIPRPAQGE